MPTSNCTDYTDCINLFLGGHILDHQLVKNSKLMENEKSALDRPLLIEELDESVNKCNIRSAPEPVVIDVLWGKVATEVGTFLAKSMNLVPTFPHGPQIVKL